MHAAARLVLALSVSLLPLAALAVELPAELVEAPVVQASIEVEADAVADYAEAWEAHLRSERAERIADLRAYADAGVFPRKRGVPGWHHQFLDADGNPCAVASLIVTSGHRGLVEQTARTQNDVVLSEVEGGPLIDWVQSSGLIIEEIAVIQVPAMEPDIVLMPEPVAPVVTGPTPQELQEQARIRAHLGAVITLVEVDTESSIAKAMDRLGDRVHTAPPEDGSLAAVLYGLR